MFEKIADQLTAIREDIKDANATFEKRLSDVETDVDNLKAFQTKAMTIWAIATAAVTILIDKFL